jgi:type VI secretion system protein ImpC
MANEKEQAAAAPQEEVVEELSLLDQIVEEGRFGAAPAAQERGRGLVRQFVSQVLEGSIAIAEDTEAMLNARIAQIDRLVSTQLNEVMHAEEFQRLESTWRGLHYLLAQSETSEMLRIKVLNVPKKELLRHRVRSEPALQEGLRGGVRCAGRRPLRGSHR